MLSICAVAQVDSIRMHSTLYGFGAANVLDTYLSPYSYTGIEARIVRQTERMTRLMHGKVMYQTMLDASGSMLKNHPKNVREWAAGVRYSNAWMYNFSTDMVPRVGRWSLFAGLEASGYLGGIYNTRNGNNPAQAKADIMVDLVGQARYAMRVGRRSWLWRYQLTVPFVGVAFSPQYGQSYYELFCGGNYDHNVVFANPVSMPSMRHLFTLDIPVGAASLRLGWSGTFMQSRFNNLRYHSYSHTFMIGFTKWFGAPSSDKLLAY